MPLQKSLKKAGETLREAAADLLPPMRVELLSDREAVVDGCRGILEYNECCIRLCTGPLTVRFTGEGLTIDRWGRKALDLFGRGERADKRFLPVRKSPFTNPCKSPLFCM